MKRRHQRRSSAASPSPEVQHRPEPQPRAALGVSEAPRRAPAAPPPRPHFPHCRLSPRGRTALLRLAPGLSHQQIPLRLNPPPSPPCPAPSWALWRRARFQPGGAAGRAAVDRCRANRRRLLWGAVGAQGSAGGTTRGRTAASPDESVKPPPRRLRAQSHSRNTEGIRGPMRANEPKYGDLR